MSFIKSAINRRRKTSNGGTPAETVSFEVFKPTGGSEKFVVGEEIQNVYLNIFSFDISKQVFEMFIESSRSCACYLP